jgi:hypothetical protein
MMLQVGQDRRVQGASALELGQRAQVGLERRLGCSPVAIADRGARLVEPLVELRGEAAPEREDPS